MRRSCQLLRRGEPALKQKVPLSGRPLEPTLPLSPRTPREGAEAGWKGRCVLVALGCPSSLSVWG